MQILTVDTKWEGVKSASLKSVILVFQETTAKSYTMAASLGYKIQVPNSGL